MFAFIDFILLSSIYRYVKKLMGIAGLSVREDAVGNIFGRW
jgi:hypothetical protein